MPRTRRRPTGKRRTIRSTTSEPEWTTRYLIPLLRRLGFLRVTYTHGQREKGRDVVFADYDRFGILRYYGAQVKVGNLGADRGGMELNEIIAQLQTAWREPYKDASHGTVYRMSGVYLIVSGRISDEARERVSNQTGQWAHLVDADQLAVSEYAAHSIVSHAERQRGLHLARLEARMTKRALETLHVELTRGLKDGEDLAYSAVYLPTQSMVRVYELVAPELDLGDGSLLWDYLATLEHVRFLVDRLPVGEMSEALMRTVRTLVDALPEAMEKADQADRLLAYAASSERPAPGACLPPSPDAAADGHVRSGGELP